MKIIEIKNDKDYRKFLDLSDRIYAKDPKYVRPLDLHVKMMIGKLNTPNKHLFLALDDQDQPIARIAVKTHKHGEHTRLHFGFFECLQGHENAASALIQHAHSFYPTLEMMGPFHFRMEDPYVGALVEGFDRDPYFLMPYNPPYYDQYLADSGLKKAMDLFTYDVDDPSVLDNATIIQENAKKAQERGVTIRFLDKKNLREEAKVIQRIFNDALSRNWGYEEFLDEQVDEMVTLLKLFIDERTVAFAQYQGKDVGCLLMIPNYNPVIKSGKGKVTPSVVWNYLTKRKKLESIRGYALGVLREAHGLGIGSALVKALYDVGPKLGYNRCEISWILANNGPMNELSKAMGGKHNKIYRVYEKPALQEASH